MRESLFRPVWVFILALALVVRIGVGVYWNSFVEKNAASSAAPQAANQDGPFFYGDSDSYWKLARTIAFGRPYEFDEVRRWQIFRMPGYPALLAPLFWLYGENPPTFPARLEGAFFGTINVALVGWLALTLFGRTDQGRLIAALAAFFVALDPTEALQSVSILSEEPFMTFSLLLNVEFVKIGRYLGVLSSVDATSGSNGTLRVPLLGKTFFICSIKLAVFNAAAIYIRPSWFYFLPFAAIVLLLLRLFLDFTRLGIKRSVQGIKHGLLGLLSCVIFVQLLTLTLLAPWTLRNYRLSGKPITTTLQMGASLYDGLNPEATGASDMSFVDRFRQEELVAPSASEDVHFEIRLDKRMKTAALEWVKSNPIKALHLAAVKFYRLWAPTPREQSFSSPFLKLILLVSYLPILILGMLGAASVIKRDNAAFFLIVPPLYVTSLHVVFVSSIRYRVPVMCCFSILAAFWLTTSTEKFRNRLSLARRKLDKNLTVPRPSA